MKKTYLAFFLLILSYSTKAQHDCISAIPICSESYSETNEPNGAGSDMEYSQCNNGEWASNWYVFTAQQTTNINFVLSPNTASDDYDWAFYDITDVGCEQLVLDTSDAGYDASIEISCNFSLVSGNTGTQTGESEAHQDDQGTAWNAPIHIYEGRQYVMYVSSFGTAGGYTLNFDNTDAMVDVSDPSFEAVTPTPECGDDSIIVKFSERILCDSVDATDFTVTGVGGPYTITNIISNSGTDYSQFFTIVITPALAGGGTYSVNLVGKVYDACGNSAEAQSFNFTVSGVTASASITNNIDCHGDHDGSAIASASGGSTPYSYHWSNSVNTASISGLDIGTYIVTVTDGGGVCKDIDTVIFTQPDELLTHGIIKTEPNCHGEHNGSLKVNNPYGGITPYTYKWSSGGTSIEESGLGIGTYSVTITDHNDCTLKKLDIELLEPSAVTIDSILHDKPNCNGEHNGGLSVSNPNGGIPGYTYNWSTGAHTQTVSGLGAGTNYAVTVSDTHGCQFIKNNIHLNQPSALTNTNSVTDVTCYGYSNGSIATNASGGTGSLDYSWSANAGTQTGTSATGLSAGDYDLTIEDDNGCTLTYDDITVDEDAEIIVDTVSVTAATCGQNNGSATVIATGGTGSGYNYSWQGGQTGATISGVVAGAYDVTVTDAHSCPKILTINIDNAGAPTITEVLASHVDILCHGNNTGSATVNGSGGTGALNYSWSNSTTDTIANNLTAGTYNVTVEDASGCKSSILIDITEPDTLNIIISNPEDPSCFGYSDGQATASSSGGPTGTNYDYTWSAGGDTLNATNTGLSVGTYNVTVEDDNHCIATTSVTLSQPSAVSIDLTSHTDPLCYNDANGSALVSVSGGTVGGTGYSYHWDTSPVQSSNPINNLTVGTYHVTVSDDNSCTDTISITLEQPDLLESSMTIDSVQCNGESNGNATVTATGGTVPYTYTWDGGTGFQTTPTASNLSMGSYSVMIEDDNGCKTYSSATIYQPSILEVNITKNNVQCNGDFDGKAKAIVSGGTPNYTYQWNTSSTNDSIVSLPAGLYIITVSDHNGCTKKDSIIIVEPNILIADTSSVDVLCHGGNNGQASVSVSGGTNPYHYEWSNNADDNNNITESAGTYVVTVTDNHSCTTTATVIIHEPDTISTVVTTNPPHCGNTDGDASVLVNGGISPYSYSWSTGNVADTTNSLSNIGGGAYVLIINDNNNCVYVQNVSLQDLGAADIEVIDIAHNRCYQDSLGKATTSIISGGTAPFTYVWKHNSDTIQISSDNNIDSIPKGTYSVVVKDGAGCISTKYFTINEDNEISAYTQIDSVILCYGDTNAVVSVTATGGTDNFNYIWTTNTDTIQMGTSNILDNLSSGIYNVIVQDDSLCEIEIPVTLIDPNLLILTLDTIKNVSCYEGNDGEISVLPSGGTPNYNYQWENGSTGHIATMLESGYHTILLTDAHGCNVTDSFEVTQPTAIIATLQSVNSICGGGTGSLTISPTGGTIPYTYNWSHDATLTDSIANSLSQGTYNVSVIDSLGCIFDTSGTIIDNGAGTASITSVNDVICYGDSTGSAVVEIVGGTPSFTYVVLTGGIKIDSTQVSSPTYTIDTLSIGNYEIKVYDAYNCLSTTALIIEQPTELLINNNTTHIACYNENTGLISINADGGIPNYTYAWANGSTDSILTNLSAGFYSVTVSDNHLCTKTIDSIEIIEPTELVLSLDNAINLNCHNDSSGVIQVSATGGTLDYDFAWSNGMNGDNLSELGAGMYIATLTDAHYCSDTITVTLSEPSAINVIDSIYYDNYYGAINLTTSGGTPDYTYLWSNGETSNEINGLYGGFYTVTITDANGCIYSNGDGFGNANGFGVEIPLKIPSVITPNADGKNDRFRIINIGAFEKVNINIFNRWGDLIFTFEDDGEKYNEQESQWNGTDLNGHNLPIGSYVYIIEIKGDPQTYKGTVTIIR